MLIDVNNCIKVFMQYHFHIIYHFPVVEIQAIDFAGSFSWCHGNGFYSPTGTGVLSHFSCRLLNKCSRTGRTVWELSKHTLNCQTGSSSTPDAQCCRWHEFFALSVWMRWSEVYFMAHGGGQRCCSQLLDVSSQIPSFFHSLGVLLVL